MTAKEAAEKTNQYWVDNEEKYLKYVAGFQQKVEDACAQGKTYCTACVCPIDVADPIIAFFERLEYSVFLQSTSQTEIAIRIDWHLIPAYSRPFLKQQGFNNSFEVLNSAEES